jgi:pimeloyl-ACP methyl ester carboxylesterase
MLTTAEIITESFQITDAHGAAIECEIDRPRAGAVGRCILLPAFGLTKLDLIAPAYYLLSNGFEVVRFDPTHHVGNSTGGIADFTMSRLTADIATVLDRLATPDTVVVSISLSSRAAYRALAGRKLRGLFLLSPVVNMRHTLREVTGEDLIASYHEGTLPESKDILGFEVKKPFCRDCVEAGFAELKGTLAEVGRLALPCWFIVGTHDQWVELDEVKQVASAMRGARLVPITGANHQMFRSPVIIQSYLAALLAGLHELLALPGEPAVPAFRDVIRFVSGLKKARTSAAKASATP